MTAQDEKLADTPMEQKQQAAIGEGETMRQETDAAAAKAERTLAAAHARLEATKRYEREQEVRRTAAAESAALVSNTVLATLKRTQELQQTVNAARTKQDLARPMAAIVESKADAAHALSTCSSSDDELSALIASAETQQAVVSQQLRAIAVEKEESLSLLDRARSKWKSIKSWFVKKIGGVMTVLAMVADGKAAERNIPPEAKKQVRTAPARASVACSTDVMRVNGQLVQPMLTIVPPLMCCFFQFDTCVSDLEDVVSRIDATDREASSLKVEITAALEQLKVQQNNIGKQRQLAEKLMQLLNKLEATAKAKEFELAG